MLTKNGNAHGKSLVQEYRTFAIEHYSLMLNNPPAFAARAGIEFGVTDIPVKIEHYKSNEDISLANANLNSIQAKLMELIEKMNEFRNLDIEHEKIIRAKGFATHKAMFRTSKGKMMRMIEDDTSIIYQWHQKKKQLKMLLRLYAIKRGNPDFGFNDKLIKNLGFQICKNCEAVYAIQNQ